jgi:hypothetical protein
MLKLKVPYLCGTALLGFSLATIEDLLVLQELLAQQV